MISGADSVPEPATVGAEVEGEPGRVKFFDEGRGYGFLTRSDGGEIFFHRSEIENGDSLESGEFVLYETGENQRGPVAAAVRAVG